MNFIKSKPPGTKKTNVPTPGPLLPSFRFGSVSSMDSASNQFGFNGPGDDISTISGTQVQFPAFHHAGSSGAGAVGEFELDDFRPLPSDYRKVPTDISGSPGRDKKPKEWKEGPRISTTKSEAEEVKPWDYKHQGSAKIARIVLPHVGLVTLSCIYTLIGGTVFYLIEQPHEIKEKERSVNLINQKRDEAVLRIWNKTNSRNFSSHEEWINFSRQQLDQLIKTVVSDRQKNFLTPKDFENRTEHMWTFSSSIFFSATVITTIGYGHLVPRTTAGKVVCVFYGILGIPLLLVTVADLGKFLAEFLISTNSRYKRCTLWIRRAFRNAFKRRPKVRSPHHRSHHGAEDAETNSIGVVSGASTSVRSDVQKSIFSERSVLSDSAAMEALMEEESQVSLLFVLGILFGYTAFGACALQLWEDWSFFKSFYYCFITVTTIGFGDVVPEKGSFLLVTLLFIIVGLVITTMCIDLVGSQYIQRIHYFGRNIAMARNALALVGDKVFQFGDVLRCAAILQKRYGLRPDQIERLARFSDAYLMECLLSGKPLPPYFRHILLSLRPFIPRDIAFIRYIDKKNSNSVATSERLYASLESLDITSRCSTSRTPRDFYRWYDREYNIRL